MTPKEKAEELFALVNDKTDGDLELVQNDIKLIQDAFNTANETGFTPSQLREQMDELLEASLILKKQYKDLKSVLYGQNMEVTNWHQNGNTEPIDNFFDENDLGGVELITKAINNVKR